MTEVQISPGELMARRILLEVCIASADDAIAAMTGGADRLELNSALALGGLTPSAGLFVQVRSLTAVPIVAMVRPRPGGFAYSASDFDVMRKDAERFLSAGAAGLAFGVLKPNGELDVERCGELRELCGDRDAVFHRAFDVTPNPFEVLETLIELRFRRVMTSGQERTALKGSPLIAELVNRAAGRIEILPAGGIDRSTVAEIITRSGCDQVHASLRKRLRDPSVSARPEVRFEALREEDAEVIDATDERHVEEIRSILDQKRSSADIAKSA